MTDDEKSDFRKRLDKVLEKQKKFLDGKISKRKLSKKDIQQVNAISESGTEYKDVLTENRHENSLNTFKSENDAKVIVVNKFTKSLVDSDLFPNAISNWRYDWSERQKLVLEGLRLGKMLGKKLQIRGEQRLLKKSGKLISIKDRSLGLKKAIINKFNLAIFDDGLQDKRINYDVTIVCFNSTTKIGNGFLLPAGPLRENLSSLRNYDAIFLNGEKNEKNLRKKIKKINNKIKVFEGKYEILNLKKINRKKKYLIFSGIGNPEEFENTLKKNKIIISEHVIYPDHYKFTFLDIENIKKKAKEKNLNILTTEKDYMRLNKTDKLNINFVKIELRIKNFKNFYKFLLKKL